MPPSFQLLLTDYCSSVPLDNPPGPYKTKESESPAYEKAEDLDNRRRLRLAVQIPGVHVIFGLAVLAKLQPELWRFQAEGWLRVTDSYETFPMESVFERAGVEREGDQTFTTRVVSRHLSSVSLRT